MVGDQRGRAMIGILARLIAALGLSRFVSQKFVTFLARPNKDDLIIMHDLMESRKGHTRYRQDLHFESGCFGYPACGRKTRPRKSSYEIGVQQQKLGTPTATV